MSKLEFDYLGPYQVQKLIGRGGMGSVYQGIHTKSGESVAIKVIASGIANQPRFRRRFAAEIEALKRLKHPNIVSLVGYGEEQGMLFYSMEFVAGQSLHDILRSRKTLSWQDVVHVGIETTSALKHAHNIGIIHRDLKPANLMMDGSGVVKLTDFGIAKLFGSTDETAAGSVIGTADYGTRTSGR
jgi:serine/threonine protein kinase